MNFIPEQPHHSLSESLCLPYIKYAVKISNDSIHKVLYIRVHYINPVCAMAEILVLCSAFHQAGNLLHLSLAQELAN